MNAIPERRDELRFDQSQVEDARTEEQIKLAIAEKLDAHAFVPSEIVNVAQLLPDSACDRHYNIFRHLTSLALTTDSREVYEQLGRQVADMAFICFREDV